MKSVKIQYFALLRDEAGVEREELSVKAETLAQLYQELRERHQLSLPVELIQVAVNDEFARMHNPLCDGDRVVFIPPVAGG
jgi:molybdopterin converting factor subunit 1